MSMEHASPKLKTPSECYQGRLPPWHQRATVAVQATPGDVFIMFDKSDSILSAINNKAPRCLDSTTTYKYLLKTIFLLKVLKTT